LEDVGKHLTDHISSGPMIVRAKAGWTIDYLNSPLSGAIGLLKWLVYGTGPFSVMPVGSAAFVRSDDTRLFGPEDGSLHVKDMTSGPRSPDLEFIWTPAIVPDWFTSGRPGEHGVSLAAIALKPDSEGSVKLKSSSVWDKPIIDENFFASESDLNIVARGTRLLLKIARSEPAKSVLDAHSEKPATKDDYFWIGDVDPHEISDDELKAFIRQNASPACHPAGTCRMGPSPETSVVDLELKVHGVSSLRVVDASVFPTQVSGHPQAPIVAMTEKLADMLKESSSR